MRMARDAYPHLKFDDNGELRIPDDLADAQAIELTADIFKVLATPSRLRILLALSHSPLTVSELVLLTNLSQPLVSQHLRTLRNQRLVSVQRSGREAHYEVTDHHVAHIIHDALAHSAELCD